MDDFKNQHLDLEVQVEVAEEESTKVTTGATQQPGRSPFTFASIIHFLLFGFGKKKIMHE